MSWIRNYHAVRVRMIDTPEIRDWFEEEDIGFIYRMSDKTHVTYEIDMTEAQQLLLKLKFKDVEFSDVKVYKKNDR
jgi:hypothetical protein